MSINIQKNQLVSTAKVASLDVDYGPYVGTTLAEALAEAEDVLQLKKAEGKTIGVKIGDNPIKEYWLQYDSNNVLTFVEKAAYKAPEGGIPLADLSASVQASLQKADSAIQNVDGKADKVTPATAGNLASLDANGNLIDSGKKILDFATSEQGTKANNAVSFADTQDLTDTQRNTALANVSNQTANSTTGKMGYKVLNPTKTFIEQVTTENTIYEIRDVFDLGGTQETPVNVTLPAGSTLKFDGGVIKNADIDFGNTVIQSDSKCFENVLPIQDSDFYSEINPAWFGVIDDGVFDNTDVLNYLIAFVKRIRKRGFTFRYYGDSAPVIRFHTTGHIKITQPIDINCHCNILGYPVFYYKGAHTQDGAAITLNNGYSVIIEINVTSQFNRYETTVDLSDGIRFAGIKVSSFRESTLLSQNINGFNTAILIDGTNGNTCPFSITFQKIRISNCINGFCTIIENNGWPNSMHFYDCAFNGFSSSVQIPTSLERGCFIDINSDGSYLPNSWIIQNNNIEGKILTKPVDFINVNSSSGICSNWSILNNRIENTGGCLINSNVYFANSSYQSAMFATNYCKIKDVSLYAYDKTIEGYGIFNLKGYVVNTENRNIQNPILIDYNYIKENQLLFTADWGMTATPKKIKVSNATTAGLSCIMLKFKVGQVITLRRLNTTSTLSIMFSNPNSYNLISVPSNIASIGYYSATIGAIKALASNDSTNLGLIYIVSNQSQEDYDICICWTLGNKDINFELCSNKLVEFYQNGIINQGTFAQRPKLMNSRFNIGDKYYVEDRKINIFANTIANNGYVTWGCDDGNAPALRRGTTTQRPTYYADMDEGQPYYDTTLNKKIFLNKTSAQILQTTVAYSNKKFVANNIEGLSIFPIFSAGANQKIWAATTNNDDAELLLLYDREFDSGYGFIGASATTYPYLLLDNRRFGSGCAFTLNNITGTWVDSTGTAV